jgi:hypothetical protein
VRAKPEDQWDQELLANRRLAGIAILRNYNLDKPLLDAQA